MQRINISIVNPDLTLKRTLLKIDETQLRLVGGAFRVPSAEISGVLDIARSIAARDRPCKLDLIAHARDGVLHLARWMISATETESASLQSQLKQGSIDEVRLLGCLTAETAAGRAAMRHLKAVLGVGVKVYGTTNLIGARDFDEPGFKNDGLLIEHDDLPQDLAAPAVNDAAWFASLEQAPAIDQLEDTLQPETEDEAYANVRRYESPGNWDVKPASLQLGALTSLLANRAPDLRVAPGLLLLPDAEALFPASLASGTTQYFRVTSLLGGRLLRVYPKNKPDGVLLRPAQQVVL